MKEQLISFRPIPHYEDYGVSREGLVYSFKRGKLLKQGNRRGYKKVTLSKNGKVEMFAVHRLVAQVFLPLVVGKDYINHKDSNRYNNHVDNLEWCTMSENIKHGWDHGNITGHNQPHTEESKQLISKNSMGIFPTKETKLKMSMSRRGKKHSEETRDKLSKVNKYTRSIKNIRNNVKHTSITQAALNEGVSQSTIYRGLKDGRYEYIT